MWDIFGEGVLGSNTAGVDRASLAGLGESIVTRVEIFPLFEVLRKMVGLGREFAVETEESLLVGREGADVDLVLLVGVHVEVILCTRGFCVGVKTLLSELLWDRLNVCRFYYGLRLYDVGLLGVGCGRCVVCVRCPGQQ